MDLHLLAFIVMCLCALLLFAALQFDWRRAYWGAWLGIGVGAMTFLAIATACATLRPQIQTARDDLVLACRQLTAALAADTEPSKAERIAGDVCAIERLAEPIEHAVAKATGAPDLFTSDPPPDIASPPAQP